MKKMNLGATTSTMGLFTTSGTWAFMQDSWTEISAQILIAQIGSTYSPSTPYVLYGCVATISGGSTTISAGAIFYNGEVFVVPASAPITIPGGDVILCLLNTANNYTEPDGLTAADPASYEDGTPRPTYDIQTIAYTTGPSGGSGIGGYKFDFSAMVNTNLWVNAGSSLTVSTAPTTGAAGIAAVGYNKYIIKGKTIHWVFRGTLTSSGGCAGILVNIPAAITLTDTSGGLLAGVCNIGNVCYPIWGTNDLFGNPSVLLFFPANTSGNISMNISIEIE